MKVLWNVLLALFLAHGWAWTTFLKERQLLNENQRFWILVLMGFVLLCQQIKLNWPKRKDRSAVERQRRICEHCLDSLLEQYRDTLAQAGHKTGWEHVRANLSLKTYGWVRCLTRPSWIEGLMLYRKYLKIYYTSCPPKLAYSPSELSAVWTKGCGAIGSAWETRDMTIFDAVDTAYRAPAKRIPARLHGFATGMKSILAVPIVAEGDKVVGVLALDSTDDLTQTQFHEPAVCKLAASFAETLRPLCFSDGVSLKSS